MAQNIPTLIINGNMHILQDAASIKIAESSVLPILENLPIKKSVKIANLLVKTGADKEGYIPDERIVKYARCQYGNNVELCIQRRQALCKTAEERDAYQQILENKYRLQPEEFVSLIQEMDKMASINHKTYSYLGYERLITIDPIESVFDFKND